MEVIFKKSFLKSAENIPWKIQELLAKQIDIFKKNPDDNRLHNKKLSGKLKDFYSLRLTRDYRIIYYFESKNKAMFVYIGHRKDIYK